MKKHKSLFSACLGIITLLASGVRAHCPLCTAGAAVAAGGAVWLGVSKVIVALFIGAFSMSMGLWFSRIIKKKYIPYQNFILVVSIFLLTVLPIMPILNQTTPFYLSLFGSYGSLFNSTYTVNLSLFSSLLGGIIVFVSPKINKKIRRKMNGKGIPFQGILLTFLLLLFTSLLIHFTLV